MDDIDVGGCDNALHVIFLEEEWMTLMLRL